MKCDVGDVIEPHLHVLSPSGVGTPTADSTAAHGDETDMSLLTQYITCDEKDGTPRCKAAVHGVGLTSVRREARLENGG